MNRPRTIPTILALAALIVLSSLARAQDNPAPKVPDATPVGPSQPTPAPEPVAAPVVAASPAVPPVPSPPPVPDPALAKAIEHLKVTPIATDPNAIAYLDLIAAGKATAPQVNDFAAYVAKRGMPKIAQSFQEYALKLKPEDPTLWLNMGTLQRTNGSLGHAESAFKKAIAIDPTNALAHYNLGSVYDAQKNYDAAIEEYRRALVLDPDLADPRKNPQVVNNENLLAVKLEIYQNQAGSLGLPMLQMQKPAPTPKPAKKP
jgi:hypothetical protein